MNKPWARSARETGRDLLATMTKAEVMRRLREDVLADRSMRNAASRYGVSPQYLSKVLLEQKPLGPKLLGALGLKRVRRVEYQPIA